MGKLAFTGGKPIRTKPFPKWPVFDQREIDGVTAVLKSGDWWFGEKVKEFQSKFAAIHEAKHGVAVSNGTVALEVALKAAGVKAGDEVIVPPYTFIASASSILNIGAIAVFADIEPDSLNLDADAARKVITPRTKAIMPVHTGGTPANMDAILSLAKEYNLAVIEDAAQAQGAEWKGRKVGAIGTAGTFSFQATKNMSGGEGGIVLTNDDQIADLAYAYHHVGRLKTSEWYEHPILGTNYRMTEMQAALLLAQMERLEEHMEIRDRNVSYLFEQLNQIEGLQCYDLPEGVTRSSWHVVRIQYEPEAWGGIRKATLAKAVAAEGVPATTTWSLPLYKQDVFQRIDETASAAFIASGNTLSYKNVHCPVTEKVCETVIGFIHDAVLGDKQDMDDIVAAFKKVQANLGELTKAD